MGDLQNNGKMYKSLDNGGASYKRKERGRLQVMWKPQKVTEHTFKSWLRFFYVSPSCQPRRYKLREGSLWVCFTNSPSPYLSAW